MSVRVDTDISIHAFRVEGDYKDKHRKKFAQDISIHAFRVEGDLATYIYFAGGMCISIHAFRVEGDKGDLYISCYSCISIHAFRVEGDIFKPCSILIFICISIHAFRVEGDGVLYVKTSANAKFQSTPSVWKATGFSGIA